MAYYISLLKALSFRLNSHTIHFFFNEETAEFPLYTETLKFFNHPECMVRAAVRTITLNVYRMQNTAVNRYAFISTNVYTEIVQISSDAYSACLL